MEISEVRVKLVNNPKDRLKAFCSITLEDDFVIRDLKIIDGANGTFVAMPSRKLADRCQRCGHKNHLRAKYCNECGSQIDSARDAKLRRKLHADIAHPINSTCRERIQGIVVEAYNEEIELSKEPGYKPAKFDDFDDYEEFETDAEATREAPAETPAVAAAEPAATTPTTTAKPSGNNKHKYDNGGGYDDLIAELRRDARERRDTRSGSTAPVSDDIDDDEDHEDQVVDIIEHADEEEHEAEVVAVQEHSEPKSAPPSPGNDFGAGLI